MTHLVKEPGPKDFKKYCDLNWWTSEGLGRDTVKTVSEWCFPTSEHMWLPWAWTSALMKSQWKWQIIQWHTTMGETTGGLNNRSHAFMSHKWQKEMSKMFTQYVWNLNIKKRKKWNLQAKYRMIRKIQI